MPLPHLAPGAVLSDRYRIDAPLGEGGYGAVFRATEIRTGRAVALKVLFPEVIARDGAARFLREADLARRLSHPNTVRVLDFGHADDVTPYLVFELLEGRTLHALVDAEGPLPPARVARIAAQILRGLMEAHALGIIHRDIKPANVFLVRFEGEPDFAKILDFGIARGVGQTPLTEPGQVVGTAAYMAPEQIQGSATFASDLYALGLTMSEALAGRRVFAAESALAIVRDQLSPEPIPHPPEVLASPLAPVIVRATQKPLELRYPTAAAMLADLERVFAPELRQVPARRSRAWIAALVAAPLLLAGLAASALHPAAPGAWSAPGSASPPGPAPLTIPTKLSTITQTGLLVRCFNSGFDIIRSRTADHAGTQIITIAIEREGAAGTARIYRAPTLATAELIETSVRTDPRTATTRQGVYVLVVTINDPKEPKNALARWAVVEIGAENRNQEKPDRVRRPVPR